MREQLLETVQRRIGEVVDSHDPSGALAPDLAQLVEELVGAGEPDPAVHHVVGWYHWLRAAALPQEEQQQPIQLALQWLWPIAVNKPELVPGPVLAFLAPRLNNVALKIRAEGLHTGSIDQIRHTTFLYQRILDEIPADDPHRGTYLCNLAMALHGVLDLAPDVDTIDLLLRTGRAAVEACPAGHPNRAIALDELSLALQKKVLLTRDRALLDEAVRVGRAAVEASYATADQATCLSNLGGALKMLFDIDPTAGTAKELLQVSRAAVTQSQKVKYLANLSGALTMVFSWNGDKALLPEAVEAALAAVEATPPDHPRRRQRLSVLADTLSELLDHKAEPELRRRMTFVRRAVRLSAEEAPLHAMFHADLASALQTLYEEYGDRSALAEAVKVARHNRAEFDHDDENWQAGLITLTSLLTAEFEVGGDAAVLQEAVEAGREACSVVGTEHPNALSARLSLSNAVLTLYKQTGKPDLLREAVERARESISLSSDDNRLEPYTVLCAALHSHFERTGDAQSLHEAVEAGRRAVELEAAEGRAHQFSNLGLVLQSAYRHRADVDALRDAVQVCRSAVELANTNDPRYPNYLTNLSISLGDLAWLERDASKLSEALEFSRAAGQAAPATHANQTRYLTNQAALLHQLFELTEDDTYLHEALRAQHQVLDWTPDHHPDRATRLMNLGSSLNSLYKLTGDKAHLNEERHCYADAAFAISAPLQHRLRAARQAAERDLRAGDPQHALEMAENVVRLIPLVTTRERSSADRARQVTDFRGLADLVAAAAIAAGRPAYAVELLEQTRGLLFADALDIRSDLTSLRDQEARLAEEFDALGQEIEQADRTPTTVAQRVALHERWEDLLGRIRAMDGFAGFLRPPPIAEIIRQTAQGPIVYVTVHGTSGHALVVTDTVELVALDGLTQDWAYNEINVLRGAIAQTINAKLAQVRADAQQEVLAALERLWHTVTEPVLRHLGHTGKPAEWPRLWWCPVGIMTFFPLHAAGNHATDDTVMDRVISSYTPTIRALAHARTDVVYEPSTLIVAAPAPPGFTPLPGVTEEAEHLRDLIPGATLLLDAEHADVIRLLPEHGIAHFSCHGSADWTDPNRSQLLLHDHATRPLTVADIAGLRLPSGLLAYLSACSTADTSPEHADEATHLTGACLLAGFRAVVGTLWPVGDAAATAITRHVYARLTDDGTAAPDPALAAEALHHAVRLHRRNAHEQPTQWIAHVHTGR
ncbi:CHAT domain-containing protein [Amycolatopsis sp. NPDC024027]|uniref:CHAT domain-containing protein n=1 Tax=Amycolatopsis sp. NPDC024027 TaxID=3154327 RepID=UPI0033CD9D41